MTKKLSRRDWERLSAYLDGQLSPREQACLVARLQEDADLQAALENLEATRDALRSLPAMKAPRNFTLTPEMVSQPRQKSTPLVPLFRLASVLASLLFVIVVVGDVLGLGRGVGLMQPAMEAPVAEMLVEEEQEEVVGVAAPTATVLAEDALEDARDGEAEKAVEEAEAPEAEAYVEEEEAEEQAPALEAESASPQATATPLATAAETIAPTPTSSQTFSPTETFTPIPTNTPEAVATPEADLGFPRLSPIRLLEILLAFLAIVSAVAAFLLRRCKP
jgi:negative regulator of sigma E activity